MARKSRDKSKKEDKREVLRWKAAYFSHLGGKFFLSEGKKLTEKSLEEAIRLMMSNKTRKYVILKCDGAMCHEENFRGRPNPTLTLEQGIDFSKKFGPIVKRGREEENGRRDSTQLELFKAEVDDTMYYFVITKTSTTIKTLRDTLLAQEYEREGYPKECLPKVPALFELNKKSRPDLSPMKMGQQIYGNVLINLGHVPPTSSPKASTVPRGTPILSEETKEESKTMVANRASTGAIQARDAPSDLGHAVAPCTVDSHPSKRHEGATKFDDEAEAAKVSTHRFDVSKFREDFEAMYDYHMEIMANEHERRESFEERIKSILSDLAAKYGDVYRGEYDAEVTKALLQRYFSEVRNQKCKDAYDRIWSPLKDEDNTSHYLTAYQAVKKIAKENEIEARKAREAAGNMLERCEEWKKEKEAASSLLTLNNRPTAAPVEGPNLVETTPDRPTSPTKRPHADQGSFQDDERQWKKFRPGKGCCIC